MNGNESLIAISGIVQELREVNKLELKRKLKDEMDLEKIFLQRFKYLLNVGVMEKLVH